MNLFEYMETPKYRNYFRNEQIFEEQSSGVFYSDVVSRIKTEFMGSGAYIQGDNVFSGMNGGRTPSYTPVRNLIVPSTILSASTSAYISYGTSGKILFDGEEDYYLTKKIKEMLRIQSVGGGCLVKRVEYEGQTLLNLYTPLSYFVVYDEFIQDLVESYNIFNKISEDDDHEIYILESHIKGMIKYQYVKLDKDNKKFEVINTEIEGMSKGVDENEVVYSFEVVKDSVVAEVVNICFNGEADYTEDNIALLRELVVTGTINSQTFDKISNPLLAVSEDSLEYDENNNAKISLTDRVIIVRNGGVEPKQIALESRIEQAQIHKDNIENNIFSSLAVNKSALGLMDASQLSGEALRRMMSATIARVEEKREEPARVISLLLGIEVKYSEVISPSFNEKVEGVEKAVTVGVMSVERGAKLIGDEEDYERILQEREKLQDDYRGFEE